MIIGTKVKILGGKWKNIEEVKIGDMLELGGKVLDIKQKVVALIYRYKGDLLRKGQKVLEGRKWILVEKSKLAEKLQLSSMPYFYTITEQHKIMCRKFIATDSWE